MINEIFLLMVLYKARNKRKILRAISSTDARLYTAAYIGYWLNERKYNILSVVNIHRRATPCQLGQVLLLMLLMRLSLQLFLNQLSYQMFEKKKTIAIKVFVNIG